ncbi:hypothetical protein IP88_03905, partial [alpha proteobacterium AAP81b]
PAGDEAAAGRLAQAALAVRAGAACDSAAAAMTARPRGHAIRAADFACGAVGKAWACSTSATAMCRQEEPVTAEVCHIDH